MYSNVKYEPVNQHADTDDDDVEQGDGLKEPREEVIFAQKRRKLARSKPIAVQDSSNKTACPTCKTIIVILVLAFIATVVIGYYFFYPFDMIQMGEGTMPEFGNRSLKTSNWTVSMDGVGRYMGVGRLGRK